MNYEMPQGCRAAVSTDWEYDRGTYRLTARMVCGDRNNIVVGSFARKFLDINFAAERADTEQRVSDDITEALGAMCLGCPHNTEVTETPVDL